MRVASTVLAAALLTGMFWPLNAQDAPPIWSGVYTAAQAERGRLVVQNHCSECHHEDLSGGEGPALAGSTFMLKWETHSVERLFHKIRDTMPSVGSDEVTESQKLDTVAYILQQNGFPAGSVELKDAPGVLAAIQMVPKSGPAAPRPGALVRAIGCVEETEANSWSLTQSTAPQVTTLEPMTATDKASAASTSAGTDTIGLLSVFPSPAALKGHKAIAKGLLIKAGTGFRINVMSLESLSPDCGK
jgi:S-disulfanyl-L-cysteine oxidoreductase SoxD